VDDRRSVDHVHEYAARGVGTTFDCLTKIGPLRTTDRMVITEWEPARHGDRAPWPVHRHRPVHAGTVSAGGTRFTWTEQIRFPWWMGGPAGAAAAEPVLRRVWLGNVQRLAGLVVPAGS
jgi:hypothetical protein